MATATTPRQRSRPFKPRHRIDYLIKNLLDNHPKFTEYDVNAVNNVIDTIDNQMSKYYTLQGRPDDNGLFKSFCLEQGFDDDIVKQELQQSPTDCSLTEFCGEMYNAFPFQTNEFKTSEEMQTEMHRIINLCINPMYDFDKELFYCWISSNNIINPSTDFKFSFYLWISYKSVNNKTKYYRFELETSHKQIKNLYTANRSYFVDKKFKRASGETKKWRKILLQQRLKQCMQEQKQERDDDDCKQQTSNWYLSQIKIAKMTKKNNIDCIIYQKIKKREKRMELMERYMMYNVHDLGKGKGKVSWFGEQRQATDIDHEAATIVLRKLFNIPSLVLSGDFLDNFGFKGKDYREIKLLIKTLAHKWINNMRLRAQYDQNDKLILWDLENSQNDLLLNKEWRELEFHRVYVVKKAGKYLHWALKFESFNKLLSLDWFNSSRIRIQLLDNDVIGQRIFWYGESSGIDDVTYTKRWTILHRQNLHPIVQTKQIALWVKIWCVLYPDYNILKNSCQHFARDIMGIIDINAADKLTNFLQRPMIENIFFPSNITQKEKERARNVRNKLKLYLYLEEYKLNDCGYFDRLKNYEINVLKNANQQNLKTIGLVVGHAKTFRRNIQKLL